MDTVSSSETYTSPGKERISIGPSDLINAKIKGLNTGPPRSILEKPDATTQCGKPVSVMLQYAPVI